MTHAPARPLTAAIIPARGGSKGVPRKNARPLAGLPLVAYSIRAALACPQVDRVLVSTDDEEIAAIAVEHGAEVPFLRPAALAGDAAPPQPAVLHMLDGLARQGWRPGIHLTLLPTHPFRTPALLAALVDLCLEGRTHAVTVRAVPGGAGRYVLPPGGGAPARPLDLPDGAPLWRHYGLGEAHLDCAPASALAYLPVSDPVALIDIDTPEDWRLAEAVVREGLFDFGLEAPCPA